MEGLSDDAILAYAANIHDLEDAREEAQSDLKDAWSHIREAHGKRFADSLKLAVKRARMGADKRQQADEIDVEADRILALMNAGPRVRVARGAREQSYPDTDVTAEGVAKMHAMAAPALEAMGIDPETGEFIDPRHGAGGAGDEARVANYGASSSAQPTPDVGSDAGEQASGAGVALEAGLANEPADRLAADADSDGSIAATAPVATIQEPVDVEPTVPLRTGVAEGNEAGLPAPEPTSVVAFRTHNPETHFVNTKGLVRLHGCLKPELCRSSQPRVKLCFDCSLKHDGPTAEREQQIGVAQ